jgi:hypothetical protein
LPLAAKATMAVGRHRAQHEFKFGSATINFR